MKLLYGLCLLLLVTKCNDQSATKIIEGDLYFSIIRIGSYYNQSDTEIQFYESFFDTLEYRNATEGDKTLYNQYHKLKDLDLLYKPFVQIKTEETGVIHLYLEQLDYDKIKIHKRVELQNDSNKLSIKARVRKIDEGLYYCMELLNTKVEQGATLQKSGKFAIEDYE